MDPGWLELSRFGITSPKPVLGGGWDHNLCGLVVGELGRRRHYRLSYEVPIGPEKKTRVDAVLEGVNRETIYCQCCFSAIQREADNAVTLLSTPPVTSGHLLLVCRDKAFANILLKLVKREAVYLQHQHQVSIKVFGDVLEQYYKKSDEDVL